MKIWLLKDPETTRISLQAHEPDETSFPPGPRGLDWERREGEIKEETWTALLAREIPGDEQTALHRKLWEESAP